MSSWAIPQPQSRHIVETPRFTLPAVGVLAEPKRRTLYDHVASSTVSVARDEAAAAVGIGVPLAAFHLDRLVDAGLLEAEYRRRGKRRGPGAGRPAKLYRRAAAAFEVSLPARRYELAAVLLADALTSVGASGVDAVRTAAQQRGRALASAAFPAAGRALPIGGAEQADGGRARLLEFLVTTGFEPLEEPDQGVIRLRNCPFDALANEHRSIACPMNVALLEGVADELGGVIAVPDETPGFCCVALRRIGAG